MCAKLPVLWWVAWTTFFGCFRSPCRSGIVTGGLNFISCSFNYTLTTLFLLPQLPCSFVHGWFRKSLPIVISDLWFCSVWFLVSLNLSHKLSKFMEKKNYLFSALLRVSLKGPKADESSQSTMMPVQNSVLLIDKIKNPQKLYIHLVILRVHVRSSAALL